MIFEEGGIIEIIPSCLKMIFTEGGIIEIISTFVYLIKPKRCDRIIFFYYVPNTPTHNPLYHSLHSLCKKNNKFLYTKSKFLHSFLELLWPFFLPTAARGLFSFFAGHCWVVEVAMAEGGHVLPQAAHRHHLLSPQSKKTKIMAS